MTIAEFQHWLRGYSASFKNGAPDADQWAEIQKELAKVQPLNFSPATYPVPERGYFAPSPSIPLPEWPSPPFTITCGDLPGTMTGGTLTN